MISVKLKARWERWCRWNCDLRVINHKKRQFLSYWKRCHDSQIMWPYAYYVTLESCCKMANSSSEDETDILPERPTRIQLYQFEPVTVSGRILKEYWNIVSVFKQTSCGIPWGLRNHTHWGACYTNGCDAAQQKKSACLNCINLTHFRLTVGR